MNTPVNLLQTLIVEYDPWLETYSMQWNENGVIKHETYKHEYSTQKHARQIIGKMKNIAADKSEK